MRMNILSTLENMVDATSPFLLMGRDVHTGQLGMLGIILKGKSADSPEKSTCNLTHRVNTPFYAEYTAQKLLESLFYGVRR